MQNFHELDAHLTDAESAANALLHLPAGVDNCIPDYITGQLSRHIADIRAAFRAGTARPCEALAQEGNQ